MSQHIEVSRSHPGNVGTLDFLRQSADHSLSSHRHVASCSPESVDDPYYTLGTHPDLVSRLWDRITENLPVSCQWVVDGTPVLARPDTGVIFGFARGTHFYALRLDQPDRDELATCAWSRATQAADEFDLQGPDREKYLRSHTGSIYYFSGGSTLDITVAGPDWMICRFLEQEKRWCRNAYDFAQ